MRKKELKLTKRYCENEKKRKLENLKIQEENEEKDEEQGRKH